MLTTVSSTLLILKHQLEAHRIELTFLRTVYLADSSVVVLSEGIEDSYVYLYSVDFFSSQPVTDEEHYEGKVKWDSDSSVSTVNVFVNNGEEQEAKLRVGWEDGKYTLWYLENYMEIVSY